MAYAAAGIVIFLMSRALGELTLANPGTGGFGEHARLYLGERLGFITSWSYWLIWMWVGTTEITGIGLLMHYWYPGLAQWLPALISVGALYLVNIAAARFAVVAL